MRDRDTDSEQGGRLSRSRQHRGSEQVRSSSPCVSDSSTLAARPCSGKQQLEFTQTVSDPFRQLVWLNAGRTLRGDLNTTQ